ncbi:MAG: hypothetical protein GY755_04630 [Chloroflexi bacterium]|nr:hypothetical protein [Chloroflexota bacterium]
MFWELRFAAARITQYVVRNLLHYALCSTTVCNGDEETASSNYDTCKTESSVIEFANPRLHEFVDRSRSLFLAFKDLHVVPIDPHGWMPIEMP